jgi:hypothetical protein
LVEVCAYTESTSKKNAERASSDIFSSISKIHQSPSMAADARREPELMILTFLEVQKFLFFGSSLKCTDRSAVLPSSKQCGSPESSFLTAIYNQHFAI